MTFIEQMEHQFGSEAALGIHFVLETGWSLSAEDYDEYCSSTNNPAVAAYSVFPDGTSAVCCTDYARQIYKAMPDRTVIFGFTNTANPTSRVAREQYHPGGHDFAVVDDRYIVDPWVRLVAGRLLQIVFDLQDPLEAANALDIYGPRACWKVMPV